MKFKDFNQEVNPLDEPCYSVETATGIHNKLKLSDVNAYMRQDVNAKIYWTIPLGYIILKTDNLLIVDAIINLQEKVLVVQQGNEYLIYGKDSLNLCTTNNLLACGINADTIAYSKKGTSILLPFHHKLNTSADFNNINILYENSISRLPCWLKPLRVISSTVKDGLTLPLTGDVQSQLTAQLMNLASVSDTEKKAIVNVINSQLTLTPLTADELNNIMLIHRNRILEKFYDKNSFLHFKLGDFVIQACNIKRDTKSKELFFYNYNKNIYVNDEDYIKGYITRMCPSLKQFQKEETMKYIKDYLYEDSVEFNKNEYTVVFKNGILNLATMKLEPMTPDHLESIQIEANYDPTAYSSTADEFFATATCGDKDVERLLYEVIGYTMLKTNALAKAFVLVGAGRNGKSTFLDIIKQMLGRNNYTAISFKDLASNFRASTLKNKLASLAGDISAQPIQESDLFKSITAYEDIQLEEKYKASYTDRVFSTMLYSCNKLPRTPDTSDGFYRRFVIIPFNADLSKVKNVDGLAFHDKLMSQESIDYIAFKACKAIYEVLNTTKEFSLPICVQEMIKQYRIDNSGPLSWFRDKLKSDTMKLRTYKLGVAFANYQAYCAEVNRPPMSQVNFKAEIKKELNIELIE
jgi:putative DNA primase/helicase